MARAAVQIRMFGKFEILVNGEAVLTQLKKSRKTLLFLQYLLLKRGKAVTHDELLEVLWSDSESSNPSTALRTMLHRFRALVEESGVQELRNCILTNRSAYQWNPDMDCEIDVYEMERLAAEAQSDQLDADSRIRKLERVLEIYAGPLLPGSSGEMWVMPRSVYCHETFLACVLALVDLLKQKEDYNGVVRICRKAMDVDLYDERLHMELMLALIKTGKSREALSQYYYATDLQYKQLGVQPSDEIRAIYKLIVQADQQMENDIDNIQQSIEAEDERGGAFVCEYEIFKDIYQLQRRMLERYNSTMFIALLTVGNTSDANFDPLVLDSVMRRLLDIAASTLRHGDTISRYSATQYVVLLPSVTYESGNMVMERVKKNFYQEYVKSSVMLTYKLRPLNVKRIGDISR